MTLLRFQASGVDATLFDASGNSDLMGGTPTARMTIAGRATLDSSGNLATATAGSGAMLRTASTLNYPAVDHVDHNLGRAALLTYWVTASDTALSAEVYLSNNTSTSITFRQGNGSLLASPHYATIGYSYL